MTRQPRAVDPVRSDRLKWANSASVHVHLAAVVLASRRNLFLLPSSAWVRSTDDMTGVDVSRSGENAQLHGLANSDFLVVAGLR